MDAIFFLIRLPVYLVKALCWAFLAPFLFGFIILLIPFALLGIPIKFIEAAFANDSRIVHEYFKDILDFELVTDYFKVFKKQYNWLLNGHRY